MNVTFCDKNGSKKVIKYWRLCCSCSHARLAVIRSVDTKVPHSEIYLLQCPHVSYGSVKGGKHESKPRQEEGMIPTSFGLYEWALDKYPIKWKKLKGERNDSQNNHEYFEIPPKLWFEFFGTAVAGKLEPCSKCQAPKK